MKVLVTGASGFVGRKLIPRLEVAGYEALGVGRDVDITSSESVRASLRSSAPDAVVQKLISPGMSPAPGVPSTAN